MVHGVLVCGGEFIPIIILIIIISIINQALKAAQEKEARRRLMQGRGEGRPRPPLRPASSAEQRKEGPTSIEEFLRELAGEPPGRERESAPPARPAEWHAPAREVEEYKRRLREQEEMERRRREREEEERRRREREERERVRRERERRKRELRERRARREEKAAPSVSGFVHALSKRQQALKDSITEDAYAAGEVDAETAYAVRKERKPGLDALGLSRLDRNDLRRAVVLREVLGPPVALRREDEVPFM